MGIKVKYDPVGSIGMAAYATGVGKYRERRLTEEQRRQLAIQMQLQQQGFVAGENAKDRAAAKAKGMIPIGPGAGGPGAGRFPAVPRFDVGGGFIAEGPPDSRTGPGGAALPALPAPAAPVLPVDPMTGMPTVVGVPPTMPAPIAGLPSGASPITPPAVPGAAAPPAPGADPSAPPGPWSPPYRVPGSPWVAGRDGLSGEFATPEQIHLAEQGRTAYWADVERWKNDLQGMATEAPPTGMALNPLAGREWNKWQGVLRGIVMDRKVELDRPETQAKVQEAIDNLNRLRQNNQPPNPTDVLNQQVRYWDARQGKFVNEPGEGRIPYLGTQEMKDPRKQAEEDRQQQDILKNQRDMDSKRLLAEEARIQKDDEGLYDPDPKDPTKETKEQALARGRELYEKKWGPGGTGYGTTAAPAPGVASPPAAGGVWQPNPSDLRQDGTQKGMGWLGVQEGRGPNTGRPMTENTIGVEMNGKEMEIPTIVPGLTEPELDAVLKAQKFSDFPRSAIDKAIAHAKKQLAAGKSVFAPPAAGGAGADPTAMMGSGLNPPTAPAPASGVALPSQQAPLNQGEFSLGAPSKVKQFPRPKPTNAPSPEAADLADRYLPRPRTPEEAMALGTGALFINPEGRIQQVP
jgi:hypothetical protein